MTAKFDKFKEALIALCKEHDVFLFVRGGAENRYRAGIVSHERQCAALDISDYTVEPPISPVQIPPAQPPRQINEGR